MEIPGETEIPTESAQANLFALVLIGDVPTYGNL